ncbi:hypothetical protein llg_10160 [Luteolibacter sp. LG18]|nr:hypothetical protein llg_10160 [Luteolibacter sp. LG18]
MNDMGPWILVIPLVAVLGLFLEGRRHSRSRGLLENWAASSGYQLVESELRTFLKGPFWFTSSKSQLVYRITVRDRDGSVRHGWARCGGWFFGLLEDDVEVRWDGA